MVDYTTTSDVRIAWGLFTTAVERLNERLPIFGDVDKWDLVPGIVNEGIPWRMAMDDGDGHWQPVPFWPAELGLRRRDVVPRLEQWATALNAVHAGMMAQGRALPPPWSH